jgi:hypothetical protein
MNTEIKQKWVDALRSGEYQQATGRLRSNDGFCCLGVLCDLYAQEPFNKGWVFKGEYDENPLPQDYWYFDGESELLPSSVRQWAGLYSSSPTIKVEDEDENGDEDQFWINVAIAELNDNGSTFKQIADLIEAQL